MYLQSNCTLVTQICFELSLVVDVCMCVYMQRQKHTYSNAIMTPFGRPSIAVSCTTLCMCIGALTHTRTHTHTRMYAHTHARTHAHTRMYTHTHTHTRTRTHTHARTHTHTESAAGSVCHPALSEVLQHFPVHQWQWYRPLYSKRWRQTQ